MAQLIRTDPLRDFKFTVEIAPFSTKLGAITRDIGKLGFAVVSGLSVSNEMIPYREGGMNTHPHKMVGQSDFGPITFSRGVFEKQDQLWRWQQFLHSWTQATPNDNGSTGVDDYRCDITVSVYDHPHSAAVATETNAGYSTDPGTLNRNVVPGNKKLSFTIYNAWPAGYALGDLNAGNSSIMIQQMTVNHEGFTINWNPT
jgi:phage tail-like protein